MESLCLHPVRHVEGQISLPGSKSLSNRILLLAALARGDTRITNLLKSDDVDHMLRALGKLGLDLKPQPDGSLLVHGAGGLFSAPDPGAPLELFLGNAGTAMRPLCAALALSQGDFRLTGEPRMYERPIDDLVDALRLGGAEITYEGRSGFPPLLVSGRPGHGPRLRIRGHQSSQFLTALLLVAPFYAGGLTIAVEGDLVSVPYVHITLELMRRFGVTVENREDREFIIPAGSAYTSPGSVLVEGDASSATYFLAAAAIRGGPVTVHGVGTDSLQGDKAFADVLAAMGALVQMEKDRVTISRGDLKGIDADLNHIPDAAMTIAVTALFARGPTTIRNIHNWRLKETDRLDAMARELRKTGAEVEEGHDFLRITPPEQLRDGAVIDTYDDHRMAMCFSLVCLGGVSVTINDPGCTSKTFPGYFSLLETLVQR